VTLASQLPLCASCGIPADSGIFDDSTFRLCPRVGEEIVLASYQLHRNYCGVLTFFAQSVEGYYGFETRTKLGLDWELRGNGSPLAPYRRFGHIINPWGISGFPVAIRLEEGSLVELVVRRTGQGAMLASDTEDTAVPSRLAPEGIAHHWVGGRIMGRYWYNTEFGGTPNVL